MLPHSINKYLQIVLLEIFGFLVKQKISVCIMTFSEDLLQGNLVDDGVIDAKPEFILLEGFPYIHRIMATARHSPMMIDHSKESVRGQPRGHFYRILCVYSLIQN